MTERVPLPLSFTSNATVFNDVMRRTLLENRGILSVDEITALVKIKTLEEQYGSKICLKASRELMIEERKEKRRREKELQLQREEDEKEMRRMKKEKQNAGCVMLKTANCVKKILSDA
jgi:hypothetical protein